ncbi:uncharacterized protein LOC126366417 [Pectinophora gossypiella]|uniref:uncharacterized protein LOC126366417 n=1 Tax=Pectinophora gossypiella TaxID=13191 RepID=UPI00214E2DE8|nr:uncharacterized protein LOC126366417 [Pectinophora gossypiella]
MPGSNPERPMTREESYVERRQLFKNIWEAAMHIDEKDDIMSKPKVIKTLRMDEIDKCPIGKTKKQRIKNLRHVCNRILDFCDRQDADDQLYSKVASSEGKPRHETDNITKPKKKLRLKKKVRKAKSMFVPLNKITVARVSVSERKQNVLTDENGILSGTSSLEKTKISPTASAILRKKSVKNVGKHSREKKTVKRTKTDDIPREATTPTTKRKTIKKKRGKKKKGTGPKTGSPHVISV